MMVTRVYKEFPGWPNEMRWESRTLRGSNRHRKRKKLQMNSESSQKVEEKNQTPQSRKVWYHRSQRKIVSRRPRVQNVAWRSDNIKTKNYPMNLAIVMWGRQQLDWFQWCVGNREVWCGGLKSKWEVKELEAVSISDSGMVKGESSLGESSLVGGRHYEVQIGGFLRGKKKTSTL